MAEITVNASKRYSAYLDESGSEKRLVNLLSSFGKRVCIVTDEGVCPKQAPVLRPPSGSRGAAAQSRNENPSAFSFRVSTALPLLSVRCLKEVRTQNKQSACDGW